MKRVRIVAETRVQFEFLDVPCIHAGSLRRIEYMRLRAKCLEIHCERARLAADLKEVERLFRKASSKPLLDEAVRTRIRDLLSHCLVLEALGHSSGLSKETLKENLASIKNDAELIAMATEKWAAWRSELRTALNARIELLRAEIMQRSKSWTATVVGFKRHLYEAHTHCDCFLCLDASSALSESDNETCYLCAKEAQTDTDSPSWLATKMCGSCFARAQTQGLCAFCFGHIELAQCAGRGDFKRERARSPSLGESSVVENISLGLSY